MGYFMRMKQIVRKGGFLIIFSSILFSSFPSNLICDGLRTSYLPYEDTSKVIITEIFRKTNRFPNSVLLDQKSNSNKIPHF